jgi:hypothetical protein
MRNLFVFLRPIVLVTLISAPALAQDQITFTKHVAPILQERCQVCHRSGMIAPMSLVTYEETRPYAKAIKAQVITRDMPPWHIDKSVGIQHFSNDVSLNDKEIETIVKWVDGGAQQGNPSDMPPPRKFPDGQAWQIGEPDIMVTLPKDVTVRAKGPDWWPDILVDPALTEDRYIKAIQIIPTKGYSTVHHIRTSIVQPQENNRELSGATDGNVALEVGEQGVFLNEYAIGKGADLFHEGTGRLIKAGSKINFQFHLHSNGTETPMNVIMGLKFYPKGYTPKYTITSVTSVVGTNVLDIRPGEANVRSDVYMTLVKPTRLLSYQPHIHLRGKAQCLEAIYPGGKTETLNCVRFKSNWMVNYVYSDDAAPLLPAGTTLHTITWHDNSRNNKTNPDPDAQITWGSRSVDEMGHGWLSYYYMSDEDFKEETEQRKANQSALTR